MLTVRLPQLGGTRDAADVVLDAEIGSQESVRGEPIVLFGRDLLACSESFPDQFVLRLLQDEGAAELILVGAPSFFESGIVESAQRRGFETRVSKRSAATLGV